jgi:hypothetical protein
MSKLLVGAIAGLVCAGLLATTTNVAHSARAPHQKPRACKAYFHGPTGRALKQATAKKRARRKWQTRVHVKHGRKYKTWNYANGKHYDCTKKKKWHHCQAAGYPCPLREGSP